jgi:hypothetical protein
MAANVLGKWVYDIMKADLTAEIILDKGTGVAGAASQKGWAGVTCVRRAMREERGVSSGLAVDQDGT